MGNVAFTLILQPKVMAFSLLSFTENVGTPFITVSPQMLILCHFANLAKVSAIYTAFLSSKVWHHQRAKPALLFFSLPAPQPTVPAQGGGNSPRISEPPECHGGPVNTQAGDDNVSLLPSCGHATTSQSLWYFTKNPSIFIRRLFALGSPPGLFSLLKCSCIYQGNWCFYLKGARICS